MRGPRVSPLMGIPREMPPDPGAGATDDEGSVADARRRLKVAATAVISARRLRVLTLLRQLEAAGINVEAHLAPPASTPSAAAAAAAAAAARAAAAPASPPAPPVPIIDASFLAPDRQELVLLEEAVISSGSGSGSGGAAAVLSWEPERPRLHPRQGFAWDLRGPGRQRVHWAGGVLAWAIDRCNRVGRDSRRPPPSRGRRRRRGEPRRTKTTRLFQQVTGPGTRFGPVVTLPPPLYRGLAPVGTRSPGRGSTHPGVRGDRRPATAAA